MQRADGTLHSAGCTWQSSTREAGEQLLLGRVLPVDEDAQLIDAPLPGRLKRVDAALRSTDGAWYEQGLLLEVQEADALGAVLLRTLFSVLC